MKCQIPFAVLVNLENHINYFSPIPPQSIPNPLNLLCQIYGDHLQQSRQMVFDIM